MTSAQMRDLEQASFKRGITVDDLMQRAGAAVAEAASALGRPVLVLVGPGNNGGDGVAAAQALHESGLEASLYTFKRDREEPFAGTVFSADEDPARDILRSVCSSSGVFVDALLGTGQNRPPDEDLSSILTVVNESRGTATLRIAVDVPTGIDADSGEVLGICFEADRTICMAAAKLGVVSYPGAAHAGEVTVANIGIPEDLLEEIRVSTPEPSDISGLLPVRDPDSNKGSSGRLELIAGSRDFSGAPVMCSMAAYRAGAGLVEIATPRSVHHIVAAHVVEPVFRPLAEVDGSVGSDALDSVEDAFSKAKACVVGPGLGLTDATVSFMRGLLALIKKREIPCLIDADGLNALAKIDRWWELGTNNLVLTPHPGEMSRLAGRSIREIQQDRLSTAREHAEKWNATVVLKGAGTVIASPAGEAVINSTGGPNLATAGTGDVLSGVIGALLVQGLSPFHASVCGVYLHGRAGDLLRAEIGDIGTLASDLIDALPEARLSILEQAEVTT
ncbi:MAG TPA: bifunctional ADP-dependent NAD(P)H-hydrate dehydratase/NAD(P)H-hydrate epimerase [Chloroflexi bacterium]|nr:bifunctional ADP-dependent NAD(P)H-hydrate dehydratase/NAD(P)H-hydrate epimerase [Chloroflexota bacterium]